jgi:H+/Cl- antiporter ClcA
MDTYSNTVSFTVDITLPTVSILSVENLTYGSENVPLNFAIDEASSMISYSLDNTDNVTIAGNTTLTGLPPGLHSLVVYVADEAGNTGASEAVQFTILQETEPEPDSFPVFLVVAAFVVVIGGVGAGLLVYFKKRKR